MRNTQFQIALLLLFCGVLLSVAGCSSQVTHIEGVGESTREDRELESYDSIKVEGIGFVTINYGKPSRCAVITEENLLKHYQTTVENNVLTIGPTASIRSKNKMRVILDCDSLTRIEAGGATEVEIKDFFGSELVVVASGSASITAGGQVTHLDLTCTETCNVEMFKLKAKTVDADLDGACNANLYAKETLNADVQGASSICYDGKPSVNKSQEGVGSISKR